MAPTKLKEMLPELTGSGGVKFLQRYRPCRLLATFVLASVETCIDLIVGCWAALMVYGPQV